MENNLSAVHPGEILREDVLPELNISIKEAAAAMKISRQFLHDVLAERKGLSAEMCLKIAQFAGGSGEFWARLQATYDIKKAKEDERLMERVLAVKAFENIIEKVSALDRATESLENETTIQRSWKGVIKKRYVKKAPGKNMRASKKERA